MLPDYEAFLLPALAACGPVPEAAAAAAITLSLTADERADRVAYDGSFTFVARTREALRELARAELVEESSADVFTRTEEGDRLLSQRSAGGGLTRRDLESYPAYQSYRARHLARRGA